MLIKYKDICEGWAVPRHSAKDVIYREDAELTLCEECFEDWKNDYKHKNKKR